MDGALAVLGHEREGEDAVGNLKGEWTCGIQSEFNMFLAEYSMSYLYTIGRSEVSAMLHLNVRKPATKCLRVTDSYRK